MNEESYLFDAVPPCPGPVDLAELLTEIEGVITRHVVLKDHAAAALAVWVLHTYVFELRDAVAYVAIESPEKRCGKTTLVSVLAAMAHKPLIASNITVGALFRAIDSCRPTLFIDEADTFLAGNGTMRGILNSGNTWRTAYVLRLSKAKQHQPRSESRTVTPGEGVETGLKRYSCWCPKVIALIGEVPDTIADRSIVVKLARKLTTEKCAPLTDLNTAEIKAKCARFALDAGPSIAQCETIRGEGLNDRAADTFDSLYVIARHAGEEWERKLHAAAVALATSAQSENAGGGLLLDILSIFVESGREKMFSRELAATLRNGEGGMRSMALEGSAIDEYRISKILRPYGIKPSTIRVGREVNKGYTSSDFLEALKRYVPRAEIDARIEELRHRSNLRLEADNEAKKAEAPRKQPCAVERQKGVAEDQPKTLAMLRRLRKDSVLGKPPDQTDEMGRGPQTENVAGV
jgi:putative DNA primase/helicase